MFVFRRNRSAPSLSAIGLLAFSLLNAGGFVRAQVDTTRPVEGLRNRTPNGVVLANARIVTRPGSVLESGALVVRDGVVEQVGSDIQPPTGYRVIDMSGKTIYAGLIDAYGEAEAEELEGASGAGYWNPLIQPQRRMSALYKANEDSNAEYRGQGICVRLIAPDNGILKGTSALVTTGADANHRAILADRVFQHARLTVSPGRSRLEFPNSPMGAVALARQTMYDADWHQRAWDAYDSDRGQPRPERNDALEALREEVRGARKLMIDASNELYFLRADRFAREFDLDVVIRGSGNEYRRLDAVKATGWPVVVPLNFPKPPNVGSAEAARNVSLERMMHWDLAPENAARLHKAGVTIVLTSHGLKDPKDFLKSVRKAVKRGLAAEAALAALTTTPAHLLGVGHQLGTLEAGRLANFVVTDGDLFSEDTKVLETWVDGKQYEQDSFLGFDWRGAWILMPGEKGKPGLTLQLTGEARKLKGSVRLSKDALDGPSQVKLARVSVRDARLSCVFDGEKLGRPGFVRVTAVLSNPHASAPGIVGRVVWPDGTETDFQSKLEPRTSGDGDSNKADDPEKPATNPLKTASPTKTTSPASKPKLGDTSFQVNFPLGAFGLVAAPTQGSLVLFKNATVWTCGPRGILKNASVLVGGGRILSVGSDIQPPAGATVIDCGGKHLTPGIIDCHSHMATDGGVNESTQAVTAEVRIGDFIDADDINIYRQLAGGVTTSNILHGSANPIGGQNQVIKLRWGALPEQMKFAEAPAGIKFALGENVKQSNWGDEYTTRYPQTRMGVEQIMRDELEAAAAYAKRWTEWRQSKRGIPPRRDLELDAIAEILDGKRWIHCHSYRQDEILALIRTLDKFDVRIGTFQHILEGYKVADAMARHGAMGSAFSDWWAYKFEVYDAIPYNGALMHQAGVVVSFNSDDRELARHLNHEAAKATKYGGVPPSDALKFVTLNPARQLRIEPWVGSLEPGKHADLVVWSGPPMSTLTRCEQTWIDGRRYFDIKHDRQLRQDARRMRIALVQKILQSGETMLAPDETDDAQEDMWPRHDTFCHGHGHGDGDGHDHGHAKDRKGR